MPRLEQYDDYYEREHECSKCNEKDQTIDEAATFLEAIVKQLYSKEPIKYVTLEHCLDELCHYLGVKTIPGDLTISRKCEETKIIMPNWLKTQETLYTKTG